MNPDHKIRRSTKGQPLPPLSQLKERVRAMPEADAEALYSQCLSLSGRDFRQHVQKTLGIRLSSDSKVTNFKQWFAARQAAQQFEEMIELRSERMLSNGKTEEEVRRWAIQMTMANAVLKGDGDLTLKAVDRQQSEVEAQRKEKELALKSQALDLDREKFELLKAKAEQADKAKQVTESDASPEEKQLRMRQIFGMV